MGFQPAIRRSLLAVEELPALSLFCKAKAQARAYRLLEQSPRKGSGGKREIRFSHQPALYSSQEKLKRTESNPRLEKNEHLHKVPHIQDDDSGSSKKDDSERFLDMHSRSQRRVLACPSTSSIQTVPRLSSRHDPLQVQGHALWPEYSSEDLHEAGNSSSEAPQREKHLCGSLSR